MTSDLGLSLRAPGMSIQELAAIAAFADASGYSSLWTAEATGRDAFSVLTVWAMRTTRIELGTAIVTIYARSPMAAAMHAATLSELAPERITLGIGSGHSNAARNAFGFHAKLSLSAVAEYGAIVQGLLEDRGVTHSGETFSTSDAVLGLKPMSSVPVVLGALGPKMSKLAAENFDGVLWNWLTLETMAQRTASTHDHVPNNRKDFRMRTNVRVAVDEDSEQARQALATEVLRFCGVPDYRRHFHRQGLGEMLSSVDQALTNKDGGREAAIRLLANGSELDLLGIADSPVNARARIRRLQAETDIDLLVRPVVQTRQDVWPVVTALAPSAHGGSDSHS